MWNLLTPLKKYITVKDVNTTNNVFKLHTKITVYMLVFASVLLSTKQYFGEPIECLFGSSAIPKDLLNHWCWIMGAWVPKNLSNYIGDGRNTLLPKLNGKWLSEDQKHYLNAYQWIVLVLVLQACSFVIPSIIWKIWENGRMKGICGDYASPIIDDSWNQDTRARIVNRFKDGSSFSHRLYATRFFICELFNFFLVLFNIFIIDTLLSNFWTSYLPAIRALFSASWNEWRMENSQIFPKWAKCDFKYYGPSGSEQEIDALCLMPLNVVNEKIYAIFWVWFLVLACMSGFNVIYRLMIIMCAPLREVVMTANFRPISFLKARKILRHCNFGDCFVLYQMGKNLNEFVYMEILEELADSMEDEPEDKKCRNSTIKQSSESIII